MLQTRKFVKSRNVTFTESELFDGIEKQNNPAVRQAKKKNFAFLSIFIVWSNVFEITFETEALNGFEYQFLP